MHQKLKTEIKALNTIVKELSSGVAKQKIQVEKLKTESALEMQNVEIAQVNGNKYGNKNEKTLIFQSNLKWIEKT